MMQKTTNSLQKALLLALLLGTATVSSGIDVTRSRKQQQQPNALADAENSNEKVLNSEAVTTTSGPSVEELTRILKKQDMKIAELQEAVALQEQSSKKTKGSSPEKVSAASGMSASSLEVQQGTQA